MKRSRSWGYLVGFLGVQACLALACATSGTFMASNSLERGHIRLSNYRYVVIYDSESASFIELELEKLFESRGFVVVGERGITDATQTLGVRYQEYLPTNYYGQVINGRLTISLEDIASDKTLLTLSSGGSYVQRDSIWKKLAKELEAALAKFS